MRNKICTIFTSASFGKKFYYYYYSKVGRRNSDNFKNGKSKEHNSINDKQDMQNLSRVYHTLKWKS